LSLATGPMFSGRVALGGGTLTLGGNLTQTSAVGTFTTSSPSAKIESGTLSLGGANRTFTTADAGLNIRELEIRARISGGLSSNTLIEGSANNNETRRLTFANTPTSASVFSLTHDGQITADITYGADPAAAAAAIRTALQALPGIGTVVTGGVAVIEQTAGVSGTTNEVQRITFGSIPSASTVFGLNFDGRTTAQITYGASPGAAATAIQTALLALPGFRTQLGGGLSVIEQVAGNATTNEVQRLTFNTPPSAATVFGLNFAGSFTRDITYGASPTAAAAAIQSALEALSGVGAGNVTVVANSSTQFDVTFRNALGNQNISNLIGGGVAVGGGATVTERTAGDSGTNEVQRLSFASSPSSTDTFSLNFDGRFTTDITYGANAGTAALNIQSALESLPRLGSILGGGLTVVEQTAGSGTANEVQRLTFASTPTATTRFGLNFNGQFTTDITYGASSAAAAANIQAALRAVGAIGSNVTVTPVSATVFDITFTGALGNQNIASLIGGGVAVGGGASVTELTAGTGLVNEVQRLQFVRPPAETDVFSLNYDGRFTTDITHGATPVAAAGNIQTALQSLPGFATPGGGGLTIVEQTAGTVSTNEVQRLTFTTAPGATTKFALNFNGYYTPVLTFGANQAEAAATIQAALRALPGMSGNVTVVAASATEFDITFTGTLANRNVDRLVGGGLVVGGGATVSEQIPGNASTNEVQRLSFVDTPVSTDVFALNFEGRFTSDITYGASP